jgi:hypothetical protein
MAALAYGLLWAISAPGEEAEFSPAKVLRNLPVNADPSFHVQGLSRPLKNDAGAGGTFTVIEGKVDPNSGGIKCLNDGRIPADQDDPSENFFFQAGSEGGRLLLDLGRKLPVRAIRSYSWHPGVRGPQAYTLWTADGTDPAFDQRPLRGTDPMQNGWTLVGEVKGPKGQEAELGGQYAVEFSPDTGAEVRLTW